LLKMSKEKFSKLQIDIFMKIDWNIQHVSPHLSHISSNKKYSYFIMIYQFKIYDNWTLVE
jgi:hypothetical protein